LLDTQRFEVVELFGERILVADQRIRQEERESLFSKYPVYLYCFRGSDYDLGIPVSLEHRVLVNFTGTVISKTKLLDEKTEFKSISDMDLNFLSEEMSIQEYLS